MNVVAAIPVDESLASFIGKRGSANSIVFYNRKSGSDVIIALLPNQEEDKIHALAESLLVASVVVLSTAKLDRKFGEALVACSVLGKKVLVTDDNDAGALLRSAGLSGYALVSRAEVIEKLLEGANAYPEGPVRVDVDKAFPVKGVGTVVLGVVTRGTLRRHDKLFHTSGKEVLVRSIQSQDEDVAEAGAGTRVGVSLRDIGEEEVEKGDLLAGQHVPRCSRVTVELRISAAAKENAAEGARYGIADCFSYSECVARRVEGSIAELELSAPMPVEIGDTVLLTRSQLPRIFASGRVIGKA
jgi:selenocysteine-specific translation elongation factor